MQASDQDIQALCRALADQEPDSWEGVWNTWRPRVCSWVRRHPQFRFAGEEVDYFVNRAFEKLWRAVDSQKLAQFASPAQLIQYFKLCVHSVILDELRGGRSDTSALSTTVEEMTDLPATAPGVEELALTRVRHDQLWSVINGHVRCEEERVLVVAGLVRGLPPREIAGRYPGLFGSVSDVYRIKRNLMERLSRDKSLREFL